MASMILAPALVVSLGVQDMQYGSHSPIEGIQKELNKMRRQTMQSVHLSVSNGLEF